MSSRRLSLSSILAAAAALVLAAAALPAAAYPGCSDSTPAVSAPQTLWAGLQPAASKPFADTTAYNGHQLPDHRYPLWSAVDVEGSRLFATYTGGFAIYDLADPANPQRVGMADLRTAAFPKPVTWFSELRDFLYYVDAPRGRTDVVVVAGLAQAGLTVFDTTTVGNPVARYQDSGGQDSGKEFSGVYTAAVGNRLFAFAGVETNGPGLWAYDVDAALAANGCSENSYDSRKCSVSQTLIDGDPVRYVGGIDLGGGRHLVVTSGTSNSKGLKVWEITPSASFGYQATQRVKAFDGTVIYGVATWTQGTKTYLAARTYDAAQIYDISSCLGGSCSSLTGKEVGPAFKLGFLSGWQSITFSRAGNRDTGTPYLYFGNDAKCLLGLKKEWLYDVSNPSSPIEISGTKTIQVTGSDGGTGTVDYWSYSYSKNPSGFSQVMPRMGKFAGDHFYRAAWTIMEAHKRVNVDPTIALFGPLQGYPDTAQSFTAEASNCTPTATWSWSAGADATITGSGSSVSIAWSTLGTKTVTVTNSGCGNAVAEQTVAVLDPAPAIGSVTVSPSSPFVCQPITFTATDVTGQPPLTRSWRVEPDGGGTATNLASTTDTATWTPPSTTAAGTYLGILQVSGTGPTAEESVAVTVQALPQLPAGGEFTPTFDPFPASTVQFHLDVPGATEWAWDFDGDTVYDAFTADPQKGPNPLFTYTEEHVAARCGGNLPCTFPVTVKVKNCVEGERTSATANVVVSEINPLKINSFEAQCIGGICGFEIGDTVTFVLQVEGDPTTYHFDWDGNGSFEETKTSVGTTVTHSYAAEGSYTPAVKIERGGQVTDPFPVSRPIVVVKPTNTPPPPPPPTKSITVLGPTSGSVGQALTYSASASGCTASANGWTWNTGGGSGSSNSSSITITFATAGSRSVTATNSGCSGVSGSRTVNIGANQSTLAANFTFSPALPKVGDTVRFDASASAGSPEFYYWKIGGQLIEGKTLDYVFTAPGNHSVTLEVSKQDKSCSLGMCTASTTKAVPVQEVVVEQPPPVLGNGCAGSDAENPALLCLLDGRFRVRVDWINPHAGNEAGVGRSVRSAATGDTTGFFWFFNDANIELLVKILDGTSVNGHYWVFHGGLSDVFYEITVEDTVAGTSRTYTKLAGTIGGGSDTAAFPASAGASTAASQRVTGATHQGSGDDGGGGESSDSLLLLDGRFEVTVDFLNQHAGDEPGAGRAVAGTNNAGYFWFFTQDNLELVVKMIDARPFDGHFWVFWTGLSDVKYNIEVKDTETGETWEFHNPAGKVGGGADTSAFGG